MKAKVILDEITEYLPFCNFLTDADKKFLLQQVEEGVIPTQDNLKFVYDYFDSHIWGGQPVALCTYFLSKDFSASQKSYYEAVDRTFTDILFGQSKPLYFVDVDNTLTDNAHLSKEKIDYISGFSQKDRVILSTGKNYASILNVIDDCKLRGSYSSCLNGSVVVLDGEFESVSKVGEVSKDIAEQIESIGIEYILYYADRIHIKQPLSQKNIDALKKYNEWHIDEGATRYGEIIKVLCFIDEGEGEKEKVIEKIASQYPDLVSMRTNVHTFEILRKDQHKGNTVKMISKRLGRYYRCSVGVGDSMNDLPMLNYTGVPYIVSTANKRLMSYGFEVLGQNRNTDIVDLIKKYE